MARMGHNRESEAVAMKTWFGVGRRSLSRKFCHIVDDVGALQTNLVALLGGVLVLVFGLILASLVNSQAAATGSAANIGSFSGAQSLNDLIPLVFMMVILIAGVGLIGLGGAGVAGKGPMSGR
jgi:hypothetical protein